MSNLADNLHDSSSGLMPASNFTNHDQTKTSPYTPGVPLHLSHHPAPGTPEAIAQKYATDVLKPIFSLTYRDITSTIAQSFQIQNREKEVLRRQLHLLSEDLAQAKAARTDTISREKDAREQLRFVSEEFSRIKNAYSNIYHGYEKLSRDHARVVADKEALQKEVSRLASREAPEASARYEASSNENFQLAQTPCREIMETRLECDRLRKENSRLTTELKLLKDKSRVMEQAFEVLREEKREAERIRACITPQYMRRLQANNERVSPPIVHDTSEDIQPAPPGSKSLVRHAENSVDIDFDDLDQSGSRYLQDVQCSPSSNSVYSRADLPETSTESLVSPTTMPLKRPRDEDPCSNGEDKRPRTNSYPLSRQQSIGGTDPVIRTFTFDAVHPEAR